MRSHSPSMVIHTELLNSIGRGTFIVTKTYFWAIFNFFWNILIKNWSKMWHMQINRRSWNLVRCSLSRIWTPAKMTICSGIRTYHFNDPLGRELLEMLRRVRIWQNGCRVVLIRWNGEFSWTVLGNFFRKSDFRDGVLGRRICKSKTKFWFLCCVFCYFL